MAGDASQTGGMQPVTGAGRWTPIGAFETPALDRIFGGRSAGSVVCKTLAALPLTMARASRCQSQAVSRRSPDMELIFAPSSRTKCICGRATHSRCLESKRLKMEAPGQI